jgi:hypothetical protein
MILLSSKNFTDYFTVERLRPDHTIGGFYSSVLEYAVFLKQNAYAYQTDYISNTFVLVDKVHKGIAAYVSLIADAVTLQDDEKTQLNIPHVPFVTLPALKIAKLAVDSTYLKKYTKRTKTIPMYVDLFRKPI